MLFALLISFVCFFWISSAENFPSCGDCWCAPDNNSPECPDWHPETIFPDNVINVYLNQVPSAALSLKCNPYYDTSCTTSPPQLLLNVSSAVCGIQYAVDSKGVQSCNEYSMTTYSSKEEALAANAYITHEGSCGLCSTTQDLAIYLSKLPIHPPQKIQ